MFKKIIEVKHINYKVNSLDNFENVSIESSNYIPGICISGENELLIKFRNSRKIEANLILGNPNKSDFHFFTDELWLTISDIKNKKLLDQLGSLFNAILFSIGPNIYFYKIKKPDGQLIIPTLYYFKNKFDDSQYLMLATIITPEERTNEQCGFYIDKLWQVEFDHEKFMNLINE